MAIRLFDVMLALVLLVLLCPLLLAAALGIALASPGPILYRARRVGLDGQVFTMFKFR
jgi:lipopolysaccharide/colanic/teichoic acid biosynthesis glycosyltransferase